MALKRRRGIFTEAKIPFLFLPEGRAFYCHSAKRNEASSLRRKKAFIPFASGKLNTRKRNSTILGAFEDLGVWAVMLAGMLRRLCFSVRCVLPITDYRLTVDWLLPILWLSVQVAQGAGWAA